VEWGCPQAALKLAQGNPSDALPAIGANCQSMIQRFDQIAVDLPEPSGPNPAAAADYRHRKVAVGGQSHQGQEKVPEGQGDRGDTKR
jgi:hypothetical protein